MVLLWAAATERTLLAFALPADAVKNVETDSTEINIPAYLIIFLSPLDTLRPKRGIGKIVFDKLCIPVGV